MAITRKKDGLSAPCVRLAFPVRINRVQLLAQVVGTVFWAGCSADPVLLASTAQSYRKLPKMVRA